MSIDMHGEVTVEADVGKLRQGHMLFHAAEADGHSAKRKSR
jgi:hypothetical protein